MSEPVQKIYGWYDRADQPADQPTYDPVFPGLCLFCGGSTSEENVRTIGLLSPGRNPPRSYFYRVHRTCHEAATEVQRQAIDRVVIDSIEHHGD